MAIRVKRRRRLVLLMVITASLFALGGGVFAYRRHQLRQEELSNRAEGVSAFEAGRYFDAMHSLGMYLGRHPEDVEITFKYAQARLEVKEPGGGHLVQAVGVLRRLLYMEPDHPTAKRMLLDLYVKTNFYTESLDLAEEFLREDPYDFEAMRAKVDALLNLRKFREVVEYADRLAAAAATGGDSEKWDKVQIESVRAKALSLGAMSRFEEALPYAQQYSESVSSDVDGQMLVFHLLSQTHRSAEEIVSRAESLRASYPDDPQFELLQAVAYRLANDDLQAKRWLRIVVDRKPTDELLLQRLVSELDVSRMFQEAIEVLGAVSDQLESVWLQRLLANRLIQAGRQAETLEFIKKLELDPKSANSDSELLGLWAMVLYEMGDGEKAAPILEALKSRVNKRTAEAWEMFLRKVVAGDDKEDLKAIIEACQQALSRHPNGPYFYYAMGRAYKMLGDTSLAMEAWRNAAQLAPSWPTPLMEVARALIEINQRGHAVSIAEEALKRSPGNVPAAVTVAVAAAANIDQIPDYKLEELLVFVNKIQKVAPGERQTLPIKIMLLSRTGRSDEAKSALQSLLADDEFLPDESTLLRLAVASRQAGLGLEQVILERCQAVYGMTPQIAYERAVRHMEKGQPEEGLKLLESGASQSGTENEGVVWAIAKARYLELINDPRASVAWKDVGEGRQNDLRVQRSVLTSRAAWSDREFIDRTIERVRVLTSEKSTAWRIARARWTLQGSPSELELTRTSEMLNSVVQIAPFMAEPRLLLAQVYEKLNNDSGAIEQVARVSQLRPDSDEIKLELARLYHLQGDVHQARAMIDEVVSGKGVLNPALTERAAELLAQLGDTDRAIEILDTQSMGNSLLLARLYLRDNKIEKVQAACRVLLETPTLEIVQFVAEFYASQGQTERAEEVLSLLDGMELAPGVREVVLSDYYARAVGVERAIEQLKEAKVSSPGNVVVWRRLFIYQLELGRGEEAVATAREGLSHVPEDESMAYLVDRADLIIESSENPLLRPIIYALLGDRQRRASAEEVLRLVSEADAAEKPIQEVVVSLRKLAGMHTKFLPLQNLAAQVSIAARDYEDAIAISMRVMNTFPQAVEPARFASEALAAVGRWDEALSIAQEWRRRAGGRSVGPELIIVEAKLRLGDIRGASEMLEPLLEPALEQPDTYAQLIIQYARTRIASEETQRAYDLLVPMLDRSQMWRSAWIELATNTISDGETSARWLDEVYRHIPSDSHNEKAALAQRWSVLSDRVKNSAYRQRARQLINDVVGVPGATARCWLIHAVLAESDGNLADAEASYRKTLELDPSVHVAMNNLALLIANKKDGDMDQALKMAQGAVDAVPRSANYHDTLASIYVKIKDYDAAIENIDSAIRLEPGNPVWVKRRAEILAQSGQ